MEGKFLLDKTTNAYPTEETKPRSGRLTNKYNAYKTLEVGSWEEYTYMSFTNRLQEVTSSCRRRRVGVTPANE